MTFIRRAVPSDMLFLAPELRQEDVAEIKANSGRSPLAALRNAARLSSPTCTLVDSRCHPIGMFGVVPVGKAMGCLWALLSDEATAPGNKLSALRVTRRWLVEQQRDRWPLLFNYVDERNHSHIRWLRWVGCTFIARHPRFGVEKRPFLEFVRINNV